MIFSTRYWGLVPFTVLASETVGFAILDVKLDSRLLHRYSTIIIYHVSVLPSPLDAEWGSAKFKFSIFLVFWSWCSMFGITCIYIFRGKENLQSMIKLRFEVSGVEIWWYGKPSFRNFPSFVSEKPQHEKLPKQLTALIGQSTVRKSHKDISTIQEVYTLRKDSQMILLSP